MQNMSYCQFRNTDRALAECQETLSALTLGTVEALSADELDAAKALVARCQSILSIVKEWHHIADGVEVDDVLEVKFGDVLDRLNANAADDEE